MKLSSLGLGLAGLGGQQLPRLVERDVLALVDADVDLELLAHDGDGVVLAAGLGWSTACFSSCCFNLFTKSLCP